jgi:hypothetical protein
VKQPKHCGNPHFEEGAKQLARHPSIEHAQSFNPRNVRAKNALHNPCKGIPPQATVRRSLRDRQKILPSHYYFDPHQEFSLENMLIAFLCPSTVAREKLYILLLHLAEGTVISICAACLQQRPLLLWAKAGGRRLELEWWACAHLLAESGACSRRR